MTNGTAEEGTCEAVPMDYLQLWLDGVLGDSDIRERLGETGLQWYKMVQTNQGRDDDRGS